MKTIICISGNSGLSSTGNTLEEAFKAYNDDIDEARVEDLIFYEAEKIEVEMKIVRKEVPVKKRG